MNKKSVIRAAAIFSLLILGFSQNVAASSADATIEADGLTYEVRVDNTLNVIGCTTACSAKDLVIPATVQSMPVVGVSPQALANKRLSGSLTLPDSLTYLGQQAFFGNKLTSVILPETPKNPIVLWESIFSNNKITSFTSPSWLTTLPRWFMADNPLETLTLSDAVTNIGDYAFQNTDLTSLVIPASLQIIGLESFSNAERGIDITNDRGPSFAKYFDIVFMGDPPVISERSVPTNRGLPFTSGRFFSETYTVSVYAPIGNTNWGATYGNMPGQYGKYTVKRFDPALLAVPASKPSLSVVANLELKSPDVGQPSDKILLLKIPVADATSVQAETSPGSVRMYQYLNCPMGNATKTYSFLDFKAVPVPGFAKTDKFFFCGIALNGIGKKWKNLTVTSFRYGVPGTVLNATRAALTAKKVPKYLCSYSRSGKVRCKKTK